MLRALEKSRWEMGTGWSGDRGWQFWELGGVIREGHTEKVTFEGHLGRPSFPAASMTECPHCFIRKELFLLFIRQLRVPTRHGSRDREDLVLDSVLQEGRQTWAEGVRNEEPPCRASDRPGSQ